MISWIKYYLNEIWPLKRSALKIYYYKLHGSQKYSSTRKQMMINKSVHLGLTRHAAIVIYLFLFDAFRQRYKYIYDLVCHK